LAEDARKIVAMRGEQRAMGIASVRIGLRLVQVDHTRLKAGLQRVVLSRAGGPGDKDDLVAAELDGEFIALDAPGAMRQAIRLHRSIFPPSGQSNVAHCGRAGSSKAAE